MTLRQIMIAGALIGVGVIAGMATPQASQAQAGGQWLPAGAYTSEFGATNEGRGEVWMVNTVTGQGRNCWWGYSAGDRVILCETSR